MSRMDNKVALVVGGAKGIGFAIATRLAVEGATVFLTGRNRAEVEAAAKAIGGTARGLVADAAAPAALEHVVATVRDAAGRIDALVLNAGTSAAMPLADTTAEHFDTLFAVNVRGPVFGLKASLDILSPGAAVVLVGSIASAAGIPPYGIYCATKAALRSFARTWAAELAPRGIRVNVVAPGPTDTEMMAGVPDEVRRTLIGQIPLGRMAQPDEVASAALFLLGDESRYVTGIELCVDGGMGQI